MNRSSSKQRGEEKYLFFFPLHPTWWTLVPRRPTLCLWNGSRVLRFVPEYCQKAPKGITFGQNFPPQGKHILIFKIFERRPILYKNLTTLPQQIMPEPIKSSGGLGGRACPVVESLLNVSPFEASDNGDHFRAEIFRHMDCTTVPSPRCLWRWWAKSATQNISGPWATYRRLS